MNEDTGADYLLPWRLEECVDGGGVGVVEASKNAQLAIGDIVTSFNWHWQTHDVIHGNCVQKVFLSVSTCLRRHACCMWDCMTHLRLFFFPVG